MGTFAQCDIKGRAPIDDALKETCMIDRRTLLKTFAGLVLSGCATPTTAPSFQWGQKVEFEGLSFVFNAARLTKSFTYSRATRVETEDAFVIFDVSMTNQTADPLKFEFQPVFKLMDDAGRLFEHSKNRTIQINLGRTTGGIGMESINPGTTMRREFVFEVPKGKYVVQVMVPSRLQMAFAGSIKKTGPYFIYDISSQL